MTSTVTVTAHCSEKKKVKIDYVDNNGAHEKLLSNSESWTGHVYDEKTITVKEVDIE